MSLTLTLKDNGGGPVSGEGTSITLNNTTETNFTKFDLYGDTEQTTYSGKNLLLPSPKAQGSNGITASYDATTGTITLSGTANNNWSNAFDDMPVSLAAGTYTFSATTEAGLGRNIIFYNGATNILQKTLGDNDTSVECVVPQNATSVRLWLTTTNGTNYTGKTFKAQLEAGNQASSFEPYVGIASPNPDYPQTIHTVSGEQTITISDGNSQSQEYEINLGKNLFDNSAVQIKTNATFTGTDGNVFTTASSDYRDLAIVKVQPNTKITFSINDTSTYPNTRLYVVGLRNTTTESGESFDWLSGTSTITTGNNTNYLGVIIQPRGSSNNTPVQTQEIVDSLKIQLEFGSVKTTYAPYFTPIELCKIGNYQDYIYKSGGDWYIHKKINKINLQDYSGLAWWKSGSSIKITWEYMTIPTPLVPASTNEAGLTYSSHFTNGPAQEIWNGTRPVGYGLGPDGWYFNDNYSAAGDFTSFIADTPVLVYYVLDTATDTQITNSDLISQLDELLTEAHSYNGDTVLTSSSEYLPAIMDIVLGSVINEITYTEAELSNPLTITDVEGKSQNTTLDGNIYVDYAYNKKAFSVSIFNLRCIDYAIIRGFYDRQFTLGEFPTLTIPELCIYNMPVFFDIGRREINSQCIRTDKLELNFRETTQ